MSVEAIAVVLHHSRASGTTKLVLLGIANHAGDGGAWPTVATLAKYANVTERSVQQAIAKLVKMGELRVDRQQGGVAYMVDSKRPNRYDVLLQCPQTCDRTTQHRLRNPQAPTPLPGLPTPVRVKPASPGEASFTPTGEASVTLTTLVTTPSTPSAVEVESVPRARAAGVTPEQGKRYADQARAAIRKATADG